MYLLDEVDLLPVGGEGGEVERHVEHPPRVGIDAPHRTLLHVHAQHLFQIHREKGARKQEGETSQGIITKTREDQQERVMKGVGKL
jgi:hypothetical protein